MACLLYNPIAVNYHKTKNSHFNVNTKVPQNVQNAMFPLYLSARSKGEETVERKCQSFFSMHRPTVIV